MLFAHPDAGPGPTTRLWIKSELWIDHTGTQRWGTQRRFGISAEAAEEWQPTCASGKAHH